MITKTALRLGGVRVGFTGQVPPPQADSFLPRFLCGGETDVELHIYQDGNIAISGPVVYEDEFYRIHTLEGRIWAENSAHGTLKTWAYSILHFDETKPRLQLLSPTNTCTLDQIISGMMMESLLLAREHAILHASVIATEGGAILFAAPSGTGKSTQAELWRRSRRAEILNGDKALLHFENGTALVSGLPYAGTSGICKQFDLPVRAIVGLSQGKENHVEVLRPSGAVKALMSQIVLQPWRREDVESAMKLALRLVERVPIYHLACLPEESAVDCLERSLQWSKPQFPKY